MKANLLYLYNTSQKFSVHLNISCTTDDQCDSLFANSICSETKQCICNKNYFEKSGTECALSTNNPCSSNGSCVLKNSVCIDNICQCKPLFEFKYFTCVPSKYSHYRSRMHLLIKQYNIPKQGTSI